MHMRNAVLLLLASNLSLQATHTGVRNPLIRFFLEKCASLQWYVDLIKWKEFFVEPKLAEA